MSGGKSKMKIKITIIVTISIFLLLLGFGISKRITFKDLNKEENVLEKFDVGILSDSFVESQIINMEKNLDSSNIIAAVKCVDDIEFRFSCVSQKVEIIKVFKGDNLTSGDRIDIARASNRIYIGEDSVMENGSFAVNLGFVNVMIPDNIYLVFLDRKLETYDKQKIYIQSDNYLIAPIFSYTPIENEVCVSEYEEMNSISYSKVKDNEFFLMSAEAIGKLEKLKDMLLNSYQY
jgi:hypothetical protein